MELGREPENKKKAHKKVKMNSGLGWIRRGLMTRVQSTSVALHIKDVVMIEETEIVSKKQQQTTTRAPWRLP